MLLSLFSNLFSKKVFADFSALQTDMHSHLLPGVDDGATQFSDSLAMITGLQKLGFSKFITTPHVMKDVYENVYSEVLKVEDSLNQALNASGKIDLHAAAEYYIDDEFPERIKSGEPLLTFGDNFVLIEMSMSSRSKLLESTIFELNLRGFKPVLAHVERYPYLFEHQQLDEYQKLIDADVMLQVNIRSFTGGYGEIQKKIAKKLAANDMIDFLGTDIHHQAQLPALYEAMQDATVQKLLKDDRLKNKLL
jgi:protein-tyrosine phosphatase